MALWTIGAAPDHRRILVDQKAHGHDPHPVVLHGQEPLAVRAARLARDAQHAGLRRSVDVGIEQADPLAEPGKRQREIDRSGRLSDPTLARRDRDHRADAGQARLAAERPQIGRGRASGHRAAAGACLRGSRSPLRGQHRGRRGHPGQAEHRLFTGQAQRLFRPGFVRLDLEGEADVAAFDDNTGNHLERDHALATLVVDHASKGVENLLLGDLRHG
jgi:hypothetical protein